MTSMSTADQQVWKKVLAAKNKNMALPQIEASFPNMNKKALTSSISTLIKLRLLSQAKGKGDGVIYQAHTPEEAKQKATLTQEQALVLSIVRAAGNNGIASIMISRKLGSDTLPLTLQRKVLKTLESEGHIKQFKPVNAPTSIHYIMSQFELPEAISGGVWFDDNKEYDQQLVETICAVLLNRVRTATYVEDKKRSQGDRELIANSLNIHTKYYPLLTPHALRQYVNKLGVTSATLSVKNVMECMRALELDGLVEIIKPLGGVPSTEDYDDDDEGSSRRTSKKRRVDSDVEGDSDRDREKEKAKMKAKEKARMKKRREKEKEKERKEKEKEKKRKEKEKDKEKRRKEKEKERKRKEKDKKKRKKGESDSDDNSDDLLVSIDDEKKKKTKRVRSLSISSISSMSSSSSSSDSGSDSDTSVSSIASSQLDDVVVPLKPSAPGVVQATTPAQLFPGGLSGGLTDLDDTAIIYRATSRIIIPLGHTQAPSGKGSGFTFGEESGPADPEGSNYYLEWLDDGNEWNKEYLKRIRPGLVDDEEQHQEGDEDQTVDVDVEMED